MVDFVKKQSNLIVIFLMILVECLIMNGCAHQNHAINFQKNKFQPDQVLKNKSGKNYVLCKHCIHYTHFQNHL